MNDPSRLLVCNVGHGLAVVLDDQAKVSLFDTGKSPAILELIQGVLRQREQKQLEMLLLTHLDSDHVGGVRALIPYEEWAAPFIKTVAFNPESGTEPRFKGIDEALKHQRRLGGRIVRVVDDGPGTSDLMRDVSDRLRVEILHPPNATSRAAGKGQYNANSVVIKFSSKAHSSYESVLVPSDIDGATLRRIEAADRPRYRSRMLVFPHHGGVGDRSDNREFVKGILDFVEPEFVIVSNGRGRFNNPRDELIEELARRRIRILCTEVKEGCCQSDSRLPLPDRLFSIGSYRDPEDTSCAGTIEILLEENGFVLHPRHGLHEQYVTDHVGHKQCTVFQVLT
jgi:competence protein ComEC